MINCFRIPLNFFVCVVLYNVRVRGVTGSFLCGVERFLKSCGCSAHLQLMYLNLPTIPPPSLKKVGSYPLSTMFGMCSCFLAICFGCQKQFAALLHQERAGNHFNEDDRVEAEAALLLTPTRKAAAAYAKGAKEIEASAV